MQQRCCLDSCRCHFPELSVWHIVWYISISYICWTTAFKTTSDAISTHTHSNRVIYIYGSIFTITHTWSLECCYTTESQNQLNNNKWSLPEAKCSSSSFQPRFYFFKTTLQGNRGKLCCQINLYKCGACQCISVLL